MYMRIIGVEGLYSYWVAVTELRVIYHNMGN